MLLNQTRFRHFPKHQRMHSHILKSKRVFNIGYDSCIKRWTVSFVSARRWYVSTSRTKSVKDLCMQGDGSLWFSGFIGFGSSFVFLIGIRTYWIIDMLLKKCHRVIVLNTLKYLPLLVKCTQVKSQTTRPSSAWLHANIDIENIDMLQVYHHNKRTFWKFVWCYRL